MPDEEPVQVDAPATVENVVAVVVPEPVPPPPSDDGQLDTLRARIEALQASLDAHYAAHAEVEEETEEETGDDDRSDDDSGPAQPERERTDTQETENSQPVDRPIRRGIGGWLFTPRGKRRE